MDKTKRRWPKTDSEKLLMQYFETYGLKDFEYEPQLRESRKPPDFRLRFDGRRILFQVKELNSPRKIRDGAFDPHRLVKAKIEEAWRQLRDFPDDCCCIVLCDIASPVPVLNRDIICGCALGKLTICTFYGPQPGALSNETFLAFSDEGGEMRWESGEPHKTNVSAVIVLEQFNVGQERFLATSPELEEGLSKEERFKQAWSAVQLARGTKRDASLKELRVVVYENPYASKRLPSDIFVGPWDERYGSRRNSIVRTFVGRELRELEAQRGRTTPFTKWLRSSRRQ